MVCSYFPLRCTVTWPKMAGRRLGLINFENCLNFRIVLTYLIRSLSLLYLKIKKISEENENVAEDLSSVKGVVFL